MVVAVMQPDASSRGPIGLSSTRTVSSAPTRATAPTIDVNITWNQTSAASGG